MPTRIPPFSSYVGHQRSSCRLFTTRHSSMRAPVATWLLVSGLKTKNANVWKGEVAIGWRHLESSDHVTNPKVACDRGL
jgi:hypothetical protein